MTRNDLTFDYSVGWDRLRSYEDAVLNTQGQLSSANLYAPDRFWRAEMELLERRGNASLVVSDYAPPNASGTAASRRLAVRRYRPPQRVHLHVKADLFESDTGGAFRLTTAHLSSRRVGPLVLGTRGFGRTEMFFLTNHPGVVWEASAFIGSLKRDALPQGGRYLRIESPAEDSIYPSICSDLERLRPGTGSILHFRSDYHGRVWQPDRQRLDGLRRLHSLMGEHARRGTRTFVGYGDLNPGTLARLAAYAEAGATVGVPKYCPGSFVAPYRLKEWLRRVPSLRRFALAEHFNVTILDGMRDAPSSEAYAVVYFGHKNDAPYDRNTLELMLRCDSREFPGLAGSLSRLVGARVKQYSGGEFAKAHRRIMARASPEPDRSAG